MVGERWQCVADGSGLFTTTKTDRFCDHEFKLIDAGTGKTKQALDFDGRKAIRKVPKHKITAKELELNAAAMRAAGENGRPGFNIDESKITEWTKAKAEKPPETELWKWFDKNIGKKVKKKYFKWKYGVEMDTFDKSVKGNTPLLKMMRMLNLSQREAMKFLKLFEKVDNDHSGTIDIDEVGNTYWHVATTTAGTSGERSASLRNEQVTATCRARIDLERVLRLLPDAHHRVRARVVPRDGLRPARGDVRAAPAGPRGRAGGRAGKQRVGQSVTWSWSRASSLLLMRQQRTIPPTILSVSPGSCRAGTASPARRSSPSPS